MLSWPSTSQGNGFQRWYSQGKIRRLKKVNTEVHERVTENAVSVEGVGNCRALVVPFSALLKMETLC